MVIRMIRQGKGFSEREVFFLGGDSNDIRDTLQALNAERGWTFDGAIGDLETRARAFLIEAGHDPEAPRLTSREENTSADYADRFLGLIKVVRREIADGSADRAARWALSLGQLMREHDLKVEFEAAAETGTKQRAHLSRVRRENNALVKQRRAAEHARWRKAADEVRQRRPGLSNSAIARAVKKQLSLSQSSVETIRARIKKPGQSG